MNVNGSTGAMDGRALQAMSSYRRKGANIYFGQFLAFDAETANILERLWIGDKNGSETGAVQTLTISTKAVVRARRRHLS